MLFRSIAGATLVALPLINFGTSEQKEKYCHGIAAEQKKENVVHITYFAYFHKLYNIFIYCDIEKNKTGGIS